MNVTNLAVQAAQMKGWPAQPVGTDYQIEVPTMGARTQVVTVTYGQDADGDSVAFIWSKAGEIDAVADPWVLLQLNAQLTYGRVAIRGNDVVVLHGLFDATADLQEVGKAIYWVARAADDLEQQTYGAYTDVL